MFGYNRIGINGRCSLTSKENNVENSIHETQEWSFCKAATWIYAAYIHLIGKLITRKDQKRTVLKLNGSESVNKICLRCLYRWSALENICPRGNFASYFQFGLNIFYPPLLPTALSFFQIRWQLTTETNTHQLNSSHYRSKCLIVQYNFHLWCTEFWGTGPKEYWTLGIFLRSVFRGLLQLHTVSDGVWTI